MDMCLQLFSVAELNALDEKQLEILKQAVRQEILNQIQTDPNLRNQLKTRLDPMYNMMTPPGP
jgi:hypothetical protein